MAYHHASSHNGHDVLFIGKISGHTHPLAVPCCTNMSKVQSPCHSAQREGLDVTARQDEVRRAYRRQVQCPREVFLFLENDPAGMILQIFQGKTYLKTTRSNMVHICGHQSVSQKMHHGRLKARRTKKTYKTRWPYACFFLYRPWLLGCRSGVGIECAITNHYMVSPRLSLFIRIDPTPHSVALAYSAT